MNVKSEALITLTQLLNSISTKQKDSYCLFRGYEQTCWLTIYMDKQQQPWLNPVLWEWMDSPKKWFVTEVQITLMYIIATAVACTHPVALICYAPGGMLTKWLISLLCLQLETLGSHPSPSRRVHRLKGPLKHTPCKIKVYEKGKLAQLCAFSILTLTGQACRPKWWSQPLKHCAKNRGKANFQCVLSPQPSPKQESRNGWINKLKKKRQHFSVKT